MNPQDNSQQPNNQGNEQAPQQVFTPNNNQQNPSNPAPVSPQPQPTVAAQSQTTPAPQPQTQPQPQPQSPVQPQAPQQQVGPGPAAVASQPGQSQQVPTQPQANANIPQPQANPFQAQANNFNQPKSKKPIKLILIIVGALVGLFAIVGIIMAAMGGGSVALTDYTNGDLKFSLQVPEGWEVDEFSARVGWSQPKDDAPVYENVAIMGEVEVEDRFYSTRTTPEEYLAELRSVYEDFDIENLDLDESIGEEFSIVSIEDVKVDGRKGLKVVTKSKEEFFAIGGDVDDPVVPVDAAFMIIVDEANERTLSVSVEGLEGSSFTNSFSAIFDSLTFTD